MRAVSAEYSPDGEYIYFNSDRSGAAEIWRMRPDGSQPEQVTKDGAGSWSPHVSPDGRLLAFLTPQHRGIRIFPGVQRGVTLRVMSLADGQIRVLAKLIGDRGTMPFPPGPRTADGWRSSVTRDQGPAAAAASAPAVVK
jgi:TolB protein